MASNERNSGISGRTGIKRSLSGSLSTIVGAVIAVSFMGGCAAGSRETVNTRDYVEIDNPFTDYSNPSENQKIWVTRSAAEKGIPRGGELLKKGYETVTGKSDEKTEATVPATAGINSIRQRLVVAEVGDPVIDRQLQSCLSRGSIVRPVTPGTLVSEKERLAYLGTLSAQPGGGPALLLTASEGVKPGSRLKAALYDIRGPVLVRTFTVTIPDPGKDEPTEDAVRRTLSGLADAILNSLERLAWYGRVVNVSGERIYIDAGAETSLRTGQRLTVYRGGEAVKGIGFAPGTSITSISIVDLVGPDGAYGRSADAARVQPGDYVELEK